MVQPYSRCTCRLYILFKLFSYFSNRIQDFAKIYASKIGMKEVTLNKALWGDFFLNTKLKKVEKGAQEKARKPVFVQLILENLWSVYEAILVRKVLSPYIS